MIESSKYNRENFPRKYFWTQERETRVKFNPGLSANRPSNNWDLVCNHARTIYLLVGHSRQDLQRLIYIYLILLSLGMLRE